MERYAIVTVIFGLNWSSEVNDFVSPMRISKTLPSLFSNPATTSLLARGYRSGRGLRGPLPRLPPSLLEKSFMAVPFVRWLLPITWKTGAKFSGKWEGLSAWLRVTRRRTGARKHHGATVICVAEFAACTRPSDLSMPMRSM